MLSGFCFEDQCINPSSVSVWKPLRSGSVLGNNFSNINLLLRLKWNARKHHAMKELYQARRRLDTYVTKG